MKCELCGSNFDGGPGDKHVSTRPTKTTIRRTLDAPDQAVRVTIFRTCEFHQKYKGELTKCNCNCSVTYGMRFATEDEKLRAPFTEDLAGC